MRSTPSRQARQISELAKAFAQAAGCEDWPAAESLAFKMAGLQPQNPSLQYNLAVVLRRQGRSSDALPVLDRALKLMPGHHNAAFERACALMDTGEFDKALQGFRDYLDAVPDDHDALENLSRLYLKLGDAGAAQTYACRLDGMDAGTVLLKAEIARDQGDTDRMLKLIRQAVKTSPQARTAALNIATQGSVGKLPLKSSGLF